MTDSQKITDQQMQNLLKYKEVLQSTLRLIFQEFEDGTISMFRFTFEFAQLLLRIELYEKDVSQFVKNNAERYDCGTLEFRTTDNEMILNQLQQKYNAMDQEGLHNPEQTMATGIRNHSRDEFMIPVNPRPHSVLDERSMAYMAQTQRSQSMMDIANHQNVQRSNLARSISAMETVPTREQLINFSEPSHQIPTTSTGRNNVNRFNDRIYHETEEMLIHSNSNDAGQHEDNQQINWRSSNDNLQSNQHFLPEPRPQLAFQSFGNQDVNHTTHNLPERRIPFKANRVQFINKFDGNFRNFNDFFQPFCNNVDKTDLDDATKLQILKSKLDSKTRTWLEGYSTDDDYENAKRTLLRHFNSMFALKNDVLKKFAELRPPYDDHDLEGYRRMMTSARSSYLSLKRAGADAFTITLLTKQIKGKLSPIRLSILEERSDQEDIEQVIKYLENIVDKLQDNADPFLVNNKKFTRQANRSFRENRGACIFCGDKTHSAKNCKLDLTTAEKRQLAFDAGACTGCYQQGHIFRYCRSAEHCSQCNGSHKLVDCPSKQSKSNWRSQTNQKSSEKEKQQTIPKAVNSLDAEPQALIDLNTPDNSEESENEQGECFSVNNMEKKSIPPILARARIDNKKVTVLLDPGSNINIISKLECDNLKLDIFKSKISIKVTEHRLNSFQACFAHMKLGTIKRKIIFRIVNDDDMPILLGRDDIHAFKIMLFPGDHELIPMQMTTLQRPEPSEFRKSCYHVKAEHEQTETQKLNDLLQQFDDVFAKSKFDIGLVSTEKCQIQLTNNMPIVRKVYPCSIEDQSKIDNQFKELLDNKIIESQIKKTARYHTLMAAILVMMFLPTGFLAGIPTTDPIIWKKTQHAVATGTEYRTYMVGLQDPCKAWVEANKEFHQGYYTTDIKENDNDCLYEMMIISQIKKHCDSETDLSHKINNQRKKRSLTALASAGVYAIATNPGQVISIFNSIIGFVSNFRTQYRVNAYQKQTEEKIAEMEQLLENQNQLIKELKDQWDERFLKYTFTEKAMEELAEINAKLNTIYPHLMAFLRQMQMPRIDADVDFLFPNMIPENETWELWEPQGCKFDANDNVLQLDFIVPIVDPKYQVYRGHPFKIIQERGENRCLFRYSGPQYMFVNTKRDCAIEADIQPNGYHAEAFLVSHPDECRIQAPMKKTFWQEDECFTEFEWNDQRKKSQQIDYDSEFVYIYCLNQTLKLANVTYRCENAVYRIPRDQEFTIDEHEYIVRKQTKKANFVLEYHTSRTINALLFHDQFEYEKSFKNIGILLDNYQHSSRIAPIESNWTVRGLMINALICLLVLAIITIFVVILYYKFYRLRRRTAKNMEHLTAVHLNYVDNSAESSNPPPATTSLGGGM